MSDLEAQQPVARAEIHPLLHIVALLGSAVCIYKILAKDFKGFQLFLKALQGLEVPKLPLSCHFWVFLDLRHLLGGAFQRISPDVGVAQRGIHEALAEQGLRPRVPDSLGHLGASLHAA